MNWIVRRYNSISVLLFFSSVLVPYIFLVAMDLNASEVAGFTNYSLLAAFVTAVLNRRYGEKIDIFRYRNFERQTWIDLAAQSKNYHIRRSAYLYVLTDFGLTLAGGFIFSGFVLYVFLNR